MSGGSWSTELLGVELRVHVHGVEAPAWPQQARRDQDVVQHLPVALEDVAVALVPRDEVPQVDQLRQQAPLVP